MPYYTVKSGKIPGIYETWKECELQIKGFPKAIFKKFDEMDKAKTFMTEQDECQETSRGKSEEIHDARAEDNETKIDTQNDEENNVCGTCAKFEGQKGKAVMYDLCKIWFHANKRCGAIIEQSYEALVGIEDDNNFINSYCEKCYILIAKFSSEGTKEIEENLLLRQQLTDKLNIIAQIKKQRKKG